MVLLIAYELFDKARDQSKIEGTIKSAGTWWHHLGNAWLIETNESPKDWFNKLAEYIYKEDHILITRIYRNYYGCLPKNAWDWLFNRTY